LRVFKLGGKYFITDRCSGIPRSFPYFFVSSSAPLFFLFLGETSDISPELPPIYRKPSDTKKLSNTPPELPISLA
jgi:hypothetical protein